MRAIFSPPRLPAAQRVEARRLGLGPGAGACFSSGAPAPRAYSTAWRPARAPNTRHSVSEFEPSRLAPFSDTQAHSPAA